MPFYNPSSGYGAGIISMVSSQIPTFGRIFIVFNSSNTDRDNYRTIEKVMQPDPNGLIRFYTSLSAAYNATQSNNNDVILIDANSEHSGAMITVSKNRIHFIGMDGGGRLNSQGAKISTPATDVVASVAVINNTGTRNTYRNLKIIQQGTNVAQTSGMIDTGEGTYVKNCEMEVNSILSTATQGLLFKGDTCHYEDCQIGNSTVFHTATNQASLVIKTPARYSYFINCTIINYSSQSTASLIDVPDADGVIGWINFKNCQLINANKGDGTTAGATIAEAVTSVATSGFLYFDSRCNSFNATIFAEADASILLAASAGAAATLGGIAVAAA